MKSYGYAKILDTALRIFENAPKRYEDFYVKDRLPYDDEVITFLTREGFLEQDQNGIKITYKGRVKLDTGGFVREWLRRFISVLVSIITAVAAVVSVLLQLLL